jgi:hypothetical protein
VTNETHDDRPGAGWDDDERLLADLAEALAAVRGTADGVAGRAEGALVWRTVDEDLMLASLSFDSAEEALGAVREEDVMSARSLVFSSTPLSVELEVGPQGLLGQIVPPGPGELYLEGSDGAVLRASADDLGFFVLPVPTSSPVRLRCETPTGRLVTDWFNVN